MNYLLAKLKSFADNRYVCLALLALASAFSIFYVTLNDPFYHSLSSIGRLHFFIYTLWCVITGLATILNINRLYKTSGIEKSFYKWLLLMSIIMLAVSYITLFYYESDLLYVIHIISVALYAVISVILVLICLFYLSINSNLCLAITLIYITTVLVITNLMIYTVDTLAVNQIIILMLSYLVLFITNNILVIKKKMT